MPQWEQQGAGRIAVDALEDYPGIVSVKVDGILTLDGLRRIHDALAHAALTSEWRAASIDATRAVFGLAPEAGVALMRRVRGFSRMVLKRPRSWALSSVGLELFEGDRAVFVNSGFVYRAAVAGFERAVFADPEEACEWAFRRAEVLRHQARWPPG